MGSSAKQLAHYLKQLREEPRDPRFFRVFDMDDTLLRTDAQVTVTREDGSVVRLTPKQFAVHERQPDETFDYSDFHRLVNPKPVKWMMKVFEAVYERQGPEGLAIVTIRDRRTKDLITQYFYELGFPDLEVNPIGPVHDRIDTSKADWIVERVARDDLQVVQVFDDSSKTIDACRALNRPGFASVIGHRIVHNRVSSLWD